MHNSIDDQLNENGHDLVTQVKFDLEAKIKEYRSPKIGVRILAEKMGISERTLYRILASENKPTYQTLYKIYRTIFNTSNDSLLLDLVPNIIRQEIEKVNPLASNREINYSSDIEAMIYYDKCFAELYFMAACAPISLDFVKYRYGLNGLETLEKMLEVRALKITDKGNYILGDVQTNFSAKTLKRLGLGLVEKFSKPSDSEEYGNNLIAFFAEGLSDETYNEWLRIDEEAFKKKIELSNKAGAKGSKRVFTFMVTDTFLENNK